MIAEYERELEKRGEKRARKEHVEAMASKGYSPESISDALNIPLPTVKAILQNARRKSRKTNPE